MHRFVSAFLKRENGKMESQIIKALWPTNFSSSGGKNTSKSVYSNAKRR